jgi:hypothetical protein
MVIKRVGPLSCAKVAGILYAALGAIIGVLVALFSLSGALASDSFGGAGLGAVVGVGAIVIVPVFYGCLGFVFALIAAALYNAAAGFVGGVELDVQ